MDNEKVLEILTNDGVVAIASSGPDGVHLVNTWNNYVTFNEAGHWLIPAGRMKKTEDNIASDPRVLVTIGCKKVIGFQGAGCGFLISGTASFLYNGQDYELMKKKFPWLRAVLSIKAQTLTQTL